MFYIITSCNSHPEAALGILYPESPDTPLAADSGGKGSAYFPDHAVAVDMTFLQQTYLLLTQICCSGGPPKKSQNSSGSLPYDVIKNDNDVITYFMTSLYCMLQLTERHILGQSLAIASSIVLNLVRKLIGRVWG